MSGCFRFLVVAMMILPSTVHLAVSRVSAQDMPLSEVLVEGQGWELVAEGYRFTEGPAADREGNLYFTDVPNSRIWRVDRSGKVTLFAENTARTNGLFFGPDGKLYGCRNGERKIVAYAADGSYETVAEDVSSNDLVVLSTGGVYFTDPPGKRVWYVGPDRQKRVVAEGFQPNGIIVWPDEGTLVVTDRDQPHLWAFRIEPDGSLTAGDTWYGPLVIPPERERPGSDGMTVDRAGRLYVATYAGLQVFDTQGRPSGTILKPQEAFLSNATFAGEGFRYLYVTCQDKVFRRATQTAGVGPAGAFKTGKR